MTPSSLRVILLAALPALGAVLLGGYQARAASQRQLEERSERLSRLASLAVGQELGRMRTELVDRAEPIPAPPPAEAPGVDRLVRGDTLSGLAIDGEGRLNVSVAYLAPTTGSPEGSSTDEGADGAADRRRGEVRILETAAEVFRPRTLPLLSEPLDSDTVPLPIALLFQGEPVGWVPADRSAPPGVAPSALEGLDREGRAVTAALRLVPVSGNGALALLIGPLPGGRAVPAFPILLGVWVVATLLTVWMLLAGRGVAGSAPRPGRRPFRTSALLFPGLAVAIAAAILHSELRNEGVRAFREDAARIERTAEALGMPARLVEPMTDSPDPRPSPAGTGGVALLALVGGILALGRVARTEGPAE